MWEPVAERLRADGRPVTVPDLPDPVASPADVVAGLLDRLPAGEPLVLVPHSNAGLYVAALASARRVQAVVFVDAGLPSSAPGTPAAPPALREHLATLAGADGLLPPWTGWWPAAGLDELFPDAGSRAAVEGEQRRLPLSYFAAEVPSPAGWERLPAAYLGFGDTYAEERAEAVARGWPTRTLPGGHLHQLVDPAGVAAAVLRLLGEARRD
ncbi:hypothetical protein KRR39_15725 [Nocardioides panacis]|uniref:Alpha/beta hydrolase n=1 Tax=Nocardioides panacis TaxID=2849501 RepID=A0A975SW06_9ACTN|nr:hypothetical protein [Nocardioides panacis]QWZ06955.1 hypothetical protein KRR39_15725 [Nocardioides panacis]